MKTYLKILFFLIFIPGFLLPSTILATSSQSFTVGVEVTGACDFNGVCDTGLGETESSCTDCGCNNNGVCEAQRLEDDQNCQDCAPSNPANIFGGGLIYKEPVFQIENLAVKNITFDSAVITWTTPKQSICKVYFGFTKDYEKAIVSETQFSKGHTLNLENLQIFSKYHFKISCLDETGRKTETEDHSFSTLTVIANVTALKAIGGEGQIFLSWVNPKDDNFQSVRVLRNENFYPASPEDGTLIYEGADSSLVDSGLINRKNYFYGVYVLDKNGNYSSGAGIMAIPQKKEAPFVPGQLKKLSLSDFDFYSAGEKIFLKEGNLLEIEKSKPLIISIDYSKVPSAYKKIIAEIAVSDLRFAYIFELNQEETVYSTAFIVPDGLGKFPLSISIFNTENNLVEKLDATLKTFEKAAPGIPAVQKIKEKKHSFALVANAILLLLLLLLLAILFLFLGKDKKKKKRKNKR